MMLIQNYVTKNQQKLLIREATDEDAQPLLDYIHQISGESDFLTFGVGEFSMTVDEEKNFLNQCLNSENSVYLLAFQDSKLVGSLNFSAGHRPRTRHTGEFGMSVLKDFQGLGIGSRLLDCLLDWAKANPVVKKINLRVREDNQLAIALYRARGFKEEGNISKEMFINGQFYNNLWMGLDIG